MARESNQLQNASMRASTSYSHEKLVGGFVDDGKALLHTISNLLIDLHHYHCLFCMLGRRKGDTDIAAVRIFCVHSHGGGLSDRSWT